MVWKCWAEKEKAIISSSGAEKWELIVEPVYAFHLIFSGLEVSMGRVKKFHNLKK